MSLRKLVLTLSVGLLLAMTASAQQQPTQTDTQSTTEAQPAVQPSSAPENTAPAAGSQENTAQSAPAPDSAPQESAAPEGTQKHGTDPFDVLVYRPLWALTRVVGDFNPIGKGIASPLEQRFRGLRVKGFIDNITQINTTGDDHSAGLAGRDKDWRVQKQEERIQLELRYQATEHLEFVSVNNYYWDGAYALNRDSGIYNFGAGSQVSYTQGKRIFREAYLRGNYGWLNFTLGKQVINWGKMDGKVVDIVNAADGRDVVDFHAGDYEWQAIGQWMANVGFRPTGTTTINLVWNPDFQPNRGPAAGSPWWYPFAASAPVGTQGYAEDRPSGFQNLRQSEGGIRIDNTFGALTLSGIYYYGYDRDPVLFSSDDVYHYERLHKAGYALDYGTHLGKQRLIIRSEGLFTGDKAYQVSDPTLSNGLLKKDLLTLAWAFETSFGSAANRVNVMYQPSVTHQFDYEARTGAAQNNLLHVIDISHSVRATSDKLGVDFTFYVNGGGGTYGGWAATYAGTWQFNDYVKAKLAYNDYQGGKWDIPWGAYRQWRNVTLDLKYEF
jgi:hypothetical protein